MGQKETRKLVSAERILETLVAKQTLVLNREISAYKQEVMRLNRALDAITSLITAARDPNAAIRAPDPETAPPPLPGIAWPPAPEPVVEPADLAGADQMGDGRWI